VGLGGDRLGQKGLGWPGLFLIFIFKFKFRFDLIFFLK
jgi:hypothetical protein